ncbi:MAG TPA: pyrroline-5-carboxylate reductase [bacterium]|nr:pyrroline-5-carboxylate reductase [bacterium]HOL48987.1 pyrroline-5-carboxylate reductase [bacterium]HPO51335.1 pyrroline-5-carboxylate reductase [bacterium]HXK44417.1 pyrroline-5-carboxylate reductase [bacterium]
MHEDKFIFGIIGCGNIGYAITKGLTKYANIPAAFICANDIDQSKAETFKKQLGIQILSLSDLVKKSRFIILAVKPKDISALCRNISSFVENSSIVISVAAGIKIESLNKNFGKKIPTIRMMPNLAVEYGKGLIGYCSENVPESDVKDIVGIFSKIAFCFPVRENEMFLVTAVAGSGPGFLFYVAELIYKFLIKKNFSEEISRKVVAYLFEGTGLMLSNSEAKPSVLKERVCSPAGTTIAGISKLTENNLDLILEMAFEAAEKRAIELSK